MPSLLKTFLVVLAYSIAIELESAYFKGIFTALLAARTTDHVTLTAAFIGVITIVGFGWAVGLLIKSFEKVQRPIGSIRVTMIVLAALTASVISAWAGFDAAGVKSGIERMSLRDARDSAQ